MRSNPKGNRAPARQEVLPHFFPLKPCLDRIVRLAGATRSKFLRVGIQAAIVEALLQMPGL